MLRVAMPKKDTVPMQIRPLRELSNRLHKLAETYKKESGNQVALEVIEEFLDAWTKAEQAKRLVIQQQNDAVDGAIKAAMLTRPMHGVLTEEAADLPERKARRSQKDR
jgi:hypothetical protein